MSVLPSVLAEAKVLTALSNQNSGLVKIVEISGTGTPRPVPEFQTGHRTTRITLQQAPPRRRGEAANDGGNSEL
jgi:acyl-CoA hydrolase